MGEDARSESAWCMTDAAILGSRHVLVERGGKRHTARGARAIRNMAGNATICCDASMIDLKCGKESLGVMARSTIGGGWRMAGYC